MRNSSRDSIISMKLSVQQLKLLFPQLPLISNLKIVECP